MKIWIPLLTALAVAPPLYAEPATSPVAPAAAMSDGVVRKIDADNAKLTLRHGPITNLDMPGMTMVFKAKSPELLQGLQVGDTVKFRAEEIDGVYTVTAIQAVP
jgi:Cu/Ag efflux protein CusF